MASRFWVGGTGTWDNSTTTHWSATTGGAGGASVPAPTDTVTFDGSSGGGTVIVAATFNTGNSLLTITCGAFAGTIDWSANNPNVTLTGGGFSGSGTAARTINGGTGLWLMNSVSGGILWNMGTTTGLTNPTTAFANATIQFSNTPSNGSTFSSGGMTYGTVTLDPVPSKASITISGAPVISTLNVAPFITLILPSAATVTVATLNITGTPSVANLLSLLSASGSLASTLSISSGTINFNWGAFRGITCAGGATFNAANSLDLGQNSGIAITAPSGGSHIIGG